MIGKNSLPTPSQPIENLPAASSLSDNDLTKSAKPNLKIICQVKTRIPTPIGEFYLHLYHNNWDSKEHLAIVYGDQIQSLSLQSSVPDETSEDRIRRGALPIGTPIPSAQTEPALTRIHSECFTGETIFSVRCDCGQQLEEAMKLIKEKGSGVIVYLRQEGRGIGLLDKLR
jgi:GTP cyclohydrolase II